MSNIGVTAATLLPAPGIASSNGTIVENNLSPRYNHTKLFFNHFNPSTDFSNLTDYEIIDFPPSFFRTIQYTLATRTLQALATPSGYQYVKAKITNKTIIFDELNSSVGSGVTDNIIDNLTTGDLELNNVVNLPFIIGTLTQMDLSYNNTEDRFYLKLLKLRAQEKASIFIELF